MTDDEKRAIVTNAVRQFTLQYISNLQWQLMQLIPGADQAPALIEAQNALHKDAAAGLKHTIEAQEWLTMALYGAGLLPDEDPLEIQETCQSLAEWMWARPGTNAEYSIPDQWAYSEMGAYWALALERAYGHDLITIADAAEKAGVTVQAISGRIDRGKLHYFIDPFASERQGKKLVRANDIKAKTK